VYWPVQTTQLGPGTPEFHRAITYSNQHDLFNTFEQEQLDGFHQDNSFFGIDFTLFDTVGLEKSIFDDPVYSSPSDLTSPSTSASFDSSSVAIPTDYLLDFTGETLTTSSTTIISHHPAPSSAASQGSEGPPPTTDHALTPPAESSLGLPGAYHRLTASFIIKANALALDLTPHSLGGSSTTTARLPTPPSSGLPGLPLFPPLGTSPDSYFTTESTTSRKRKASELASPRPKELVETDIHSDDDDRDVRRKRNTAAARRYRQKKQDRMKELEEELEESRKREEMWRLEAQKQRMEAEKWHGMVQFMRENMGAK
jgi:hypothetical protein